MKCNLVFYFPTISRPQPRSSKLFLEVESKVCNDAASPKFAMMLGINYAIGI